MPVMVLVLIHVNHRIIKNNLSTTNISKMDEEKNKDIQSRREFFKQATKKALPLFGMVVLGSQIQIAHAADIVNGYNSCRNYGCEHSCQNYCRTTCKNYCVRTCLFQCEGCEGGCEGTCDVNCGHGCDGGCKGDCKGNCKEDCMNTCFHTCQGGCQNSCSGSCSNSCAGSSRI